MNPVLREILESNAVTDGVDILPLRHPDHLDLPVHLDAAEGAFLQDIIRTIKPMVSLEIGLAYGVSTLYICEALTSVATRPRHIVADPNQSTQWRNIGLRNVNQAGYSNIVDFHEVSSEFLLPRLLEVETRLDFAFVDGWHTFDQVMVEFYYLSRMLRVGGVIAFDDADRRSVNRVIRHALTYPAYEVYGRTSRPGLSVAGHLRRAVGSWPHAQELFRSDFIQRDWDLGIYGSCVAIRKVADDVRSSGWDRMF